MPRGLCLWVPATSLCHVRDLATVYVILLIVSWLLLQSNSECMTGLNIDFQHTCSFLYGLFLNGMLPDDFGKGSADRG